MAKVTRTNTLIPVGDCVTRNADVQYQSTIILQVMTNVNFQKKLGQMSRSKGLIPTERSYH